MEAYLRLNKIRRATFFCDPPYQLVKGGYRTTAFPYRIIQQCVRDFHGEFILCEAAVGNGSKIVVPQWFQAYQYRVVRTLTRKGKDIYYELVSHVDNKGYI